MMLISMLGKKEKAQNRLMAHCLRATGSSALAHLTHIAHTTKMTDNQEGLQLSVFKNISKNIWLAGVSQSEDSDLK